jgi:hypothetical protein
VRTIAGVSTSIAVFLGRTKQGPLNQPVLCLSFSDFERTFSSDYAGSDLPRAIKLFFLNGGTQCYVMRLANGASPASVTLQNTANLDVLKVTAKSYGDIGNSIRLSVTYNGLQPESTFNLEVFRWVNNGGQLVKTDVENWQALSMDPDSQRFAQTYVSQKSKLINLTSLVGAAGSAYSQSGRPITTSSLIADLNTILTGDHQFRISVDGNPFVNITLSPIPTLLQDMADDINNQLQSGTKVSVIGSQGPTSLIRIRSLSGGDVLIEPASTADLARALMLGTAQGGLEVSRYAEFRPAPSGIIFNTNSLTTFAGLHQDAFDKITINGIDIPLLNTLKTVSPAASHFMFEEDTVPPSVTGHNDGIREKWAIIANTINLFKASHANFKWSAELWGSRLAILPGEGGDNSVGTLATSGGTGVDISADFTRTVRYFTLGTSGLPSFQTGGADGSDGSQPQLSDYNAAFTILDKEVDLFNLMILPHDSGHSASTTASLWGPASVFCQERRAFLLMDPPEAWSNVQQATDPANGVNSLRIGLVKDHSAVFIPRVTIRENGLNVQVGPSGAIAGLMARTDGTRGVWKAPAGTEADIRGINGLEYRFSDRENGVLNPHAINTLRVFPNGIVNWGARTMDGDDDFASEWKYIPIRRTALFIEESLYRGLKWVVFEPNDEPLWSQIRLNVGAFMHNLFRQGAFQGQKKNDAYFVKCDVETTTQNDINLGIVNVWVGFAPLKPAEFVVLYLQQMTGQIQV